MKRALLVAPLLLVACGLLGQPKSGPTEAQIQTTEKVITTAGGAASVAFPVAAPIIQGATVLAIAALSAWHTKKQADMHADTVSALTATEPDPTPKA